MYSVCECMCKYVCNVRLDAFVQASSCMIIHRFSLFFVAVVLTTSKACVVLMLTFALNYQRRFRSASALLLRSILTFMIYFICVQELEDFVFVNILLCMRNGTDVLNGCEWFVLCWIWSFRLYSICTLLFSVLIASLCYFSINLLVFVQFPPLFHSPCIPSCSLVIHCFSV